MNTTEELAYEAAQVMAKKKEDAFRAALDHYYGEGKWDEEKAANECLLTIDQLGIEEFSINGKLMLRFGRIKSDTLMSVTNIVCTFSQDIEVLYE